MPQQYIKDPNSDTGVIDTTIAPPVIDTQKLKDELDKLKQDRQDITDTYTQSIAGLSTEIDFKQNQLDTILTQVPEVEPLLNNADIPV